MEWTNEICLKLIDEYRSHPSLWDQTSPFYKNKLKRKEAWQMLADRFGCTKAEVERKMNVLLTQYRREKHKILLQSYKDGEIRKSSRWYAFKKFSFMDGGLVTKKCALQLYGAMQMRLGFPGLQSAQVLPNLLWNTTPPNDTIQQQLDDSKVPHLNNNHNNNHHDNSNNSFKNNNSSVCQPPQDLSMNSSIQNQQQQQPTNQPISLNNSTTTTITDDNQQQDEMIEVPIDPKTINNNGVCHQQQHVSINNHHKYLHLSAQQQNDIQRHYYSATSTDIKNEIFDDNSGQDYYDNLENGHDDEDDDDIDIDDYNYNYQQQQNKNLNNNNNKRLNKNMSRRKRVTFNNNQQLLSPSHPDRTSTITSHNNSTTMTPAPTPTSLTPLLSSVTLPSASTTVPISGIDLQSIAERIIKDNDKDDCDFIGCNVAMKLRSMEESQRIIAEKLIADVLFYGQFKELYKTANICPLGTTIPPSTVATASTTTSTSRDNNDDTNL